MSNQARVLQNIRVPGFHARTHTADLYTLDGESRCLVLYVGQRAACNVSGVGTEIQWGRPWLIPADYTLEQVQATYLTACKFWLEHELREQFVFTRPGPLPVQSRPFFPDH